MRHVRQFSLFLSAAAALAISVPATLSAQQPKAAAPAPQGPAPRIAYVNTQAILQQMPGYAQAESTMTAEVASYRDKVQQLQSQLDSARSAYDQQQIALSPSARTAKQQELQQMQQKLQSQFNDLQNQLSSRQQELVAPFDNRLKQILEGLRAEKNLLLIFDVAAQGNNIVAADQSLDLTDTVIQRVKSTAK